jgi:hypothetical protein
MLDNYNNATPPGTFTLLQIHVGDSYATTWGNARDSFYAITGTPTAIFDGVQTVVGAGSVDSAYAAYMAKYNLRRAVATDVTIQLGGRQVSGATYEIKAKVGIEAGGTAKSLRIYIVQVLDDYPTSPTYSRCCVIQAATTHGSEDLVTVSPGQFQIVTRNLTFSGPSWTTPSNIKIVAWAQDTTGGSKNVQQAATMSWPFIPLQMLGDMNGDYSVNLNDIPLFALALVDRPAYQALYPNIDIFEAGDINKDGLLNGADVHALVPILIDDHTPPSPTPMTWNVSPSGSPTAISTSAITMTATEATDISGVEYFFTATGIGSHSSPWQSSRTYTDTALAPNRSFSYKVKARDLSPQYNTTGDSTVISVATFIETPSDLTVGTVTTNSIQVTAPGTFTRLTSNLSGLYFEVTDMAGTPVGGADANAWKQVQTITATGLTPGTTYRFRVKARNYYAVNETAWYPLADYVNATTSP